jgi:hypothetical protein
MATVRKGLSYFIAQNDLGGLDRFGVYFAAEDGSRASPRHIDQLATGKIGGGVE